MRWIDYGLWRRIFKGGAAFDRRHRPVGASGHVTGKFAREDIGLDKRIALPKADDGRALDDAKCVAVPAWPFALLWGTLATKR